MYVASGDIDSCGIFYLPREEIKTRENVWRIEVFSKIGVSVARTYDSVEWNKFIRG